MLTADSFVRSGKVRDLFSLGPDRLLLVASDRISAFDVVLPTEIPDKGRVLTGLSRFWFDETAAIMPNQVVSTDPEDLPGERWSASDRERLRGRMVVARTARVLPVELVVRGYISGSGWKEYREHGSVCG
jgi:phosphoribosylaminoimidazole-succinocarboxamide synthase